MRFKFITLNLWRGGILFDKINDFINKEQPDILTLQEAYNGIQKKIDLKYFDFAPAFMDKTVAGERENGNAIFSRYPIISRKTIFYDIPFGIVAAKYTNDYILNPRNLQHVVIQIHNTNMNIYNTQGIWGFDGKDNKRRLNMSRIIVKEIRDKTNVMLAGDFNVLPTTKTIQNIEHYLNNVFHDEIVTTFNAKRKKKGNFATSVVDMLFISKNIKVLFHSCPQVDISDHLPLVGVFEI